MISVTLRSRPAAGFEGGTLFYTAGGRSVCRVLTVTRHRRAGDKPTVPTLLKIMYEPVKKEDVPEGVPILPWPVAKNPPRTRKPRDQEVKTAAREATIQPKMGFINRRPQRFSQWDDEDQVVPLMMTIPILDHQGNTLRGPLAKTANWVDPEDNNVTRRGPRMIRGMTRVDPVRRLMQRNALFDEAHVVAADCYRLAWELGPGKGPPGSRYGEPKIYTPGPGFGPSDDHVAKIVAWKHLQRYIDDGVRAIELLRHVVLNRGHITAWAAERRIDKKMATGYLLAILARLVLYFDDEIEKRMRPGKLELT